MLFKSFSDFYTRLQFFLIVQNFISYQIFYIYKIKKLLNKKFLVFFYYLSSFYNNYLKLLKNFFNNLYRYHWFRVSLLYFVGIKSFGSYHNTTYSNNELNINNKLKNSLNRYSFFHNQFIFSESRLKFFNKTFKSFFYYQLVSPNSFKYSNIIKYLGFCSKHFFFAYLNYLVSKKYKTRNERLFKNFLLKNRFALKGYINGIVLSLFSQLNYDLRVQNLKSKFKNFIFKSLNTDFGFFNYKQKPLKKLGFSNFFLEPDNYYSGLRSKLLKKYKNDKIYYKFRKIKFNLLLNRFGLNTSNLNLDKLKLKKRNIINKKTSFYKSNLNSYNTFSYTFPVLGKMSIHKKLSKIYQKPKINKFNFISSYGKYYNYEIRKNWKRLLKVRKPIYRRSYKNLNNFSIILYNYHINKVNKFIYRPLLKDKVFTPYKLLINKALRRYKTKKNKHSLFDFSLNPEKHLIPIIKDIGYDRFVNRFCLKPETYNFFYRNNFYIYTSKYKSLSFMKLKSNRTYHSQFFHKIKYRSGFRLNTVHFFNRLLWLIRNKVKSLPTHMHMGLLPLEIRARKKAKLKVSLTHTFKVFLGRYKLLQNNDIRFSFNKGYVKRFIYSNFLTLFVYKNFNKSKQKTKIFFRSFNSSKHWRRIIKYEKNRFLKTVQYLQNRIAYYKNFLNYFSPSLLVLDSSMFTPILRSGKLYSIDKVLYKLKVSAFINNLDIYKYWKKLIFLFDRSFKFNLKTYGRRKVLKKTIVPAYAVPLPTRLHSFYNDLYYIKELNSVNKFLKFIFQMKKTNELQYYKNVLMSLDMDFDFISLYKKDRLAKAKDIDKKKRLDKAKNKNLK